MGSDKARPAYVDDVDETSGKAVRGTRRSASTREKPKVSQRDSRKGKKPHDDRAYPAESSTNVQDVEVKLERRKSTSSSTRSPHKSSRPPSAHENRGFPKVSIPSTSRTVNPSHFGIPSSATARAAPTVASQAIPLRPRAFTSQTYPRPQSFHAAQTSAAGFGPPLSMSAYYQPQPLITPSYPPPSPSSSYMRYAATPQYSVNAAPQYTVAAQPDYFSQPAPSRPLSSRFSPLGRVQAMYDPIPRTSSAIGQATYDPIPRTNSAFGTRDLPRSFNDTYDNSYFDDGYTAASDGAAIRRERRSSIRVPGTMSRAEADSIAMPPPPSTTRPGILRRTTTEYTIDPQSSYRDSRPLYREDPRPRRPSNNRHSVSYDLGNGPESVRVESANSGRRRQSFYDQPPSTGSGGYEEKLNQATSYQEDVAGPTVPLTADMLRKQQRRQGGSSRSTKSSASRDESDYKKSATTRTTRSGSGNDDENVTIKVTGQARVMVGGAQIDCTEGGEIEIKQQKSIRNGSERSNSEYGGPRIEDRRSRINHPTGRTRMSSQSGQSYTRSTPQYPMDNYF
jgi:hypothetical protein